MNTKIGYLYRDASNYKQAGEVVFAGAITIAQRERLYAALDEGEYLIAEQVGLESLREHFAKLDQDDHIWHEISFIEYTDDAPTDVRPVAEFVAELSSVVWDVQSYAARLDERIAACL